MTDSDDNAADEADFTETNLDPYLKRRHKLKFSQRPWCAYFFYFGPSKDGKRRFERYFYPSLHGPIKRKHLRDLITQLALNARLPYAKQNPQPFDSDAKNVWTRKSYMIALVDDPTFKFDDKAIKIGERASAWPESEIAAINAARIAGKSNDEIRRLVADLEQQRLPRRLVRTHQRHGVGVAEQDRRLALPVVRRPEVVDLRHEQLVRFPRDRIGRGSAEHREADHAGGDAATHQHNHQRGQRLAAAEAAQGQIKVVREHPCPPGHRIRAAHASAALPAVSNALRKVRSSTWVVTGLSIT